MARINEKNKEKLSSIIWTWIVVGILGAVVVTGIVLLISYFVELNDSTDESEYEEKFPNASLITYEELEREYSGFDSGLSYTSEGYTVVFVYSAAYELKENVLNAVNDAYAKDGFHILNVVSEDNIDSSFASYDGLSGLTLPDLTEDRPCYLMVFESHDLQENIYKSPKNIVENISKYVK